MSDSYQTKLRTIRAHYVGDLDEAESWVKQFKDCTPAVTSFAGDRYLKVHALPGNTSGNIVATFVARSGQWIVREGEASYRVLRRHEFERDFEPAEE